MKHKIIFGKGARTENQDDLYPKKPSQESNTFVVCDGVGGSPFGKQAAQITSEAVHTYINITKEYSIDGINNAIGYAEEGLEDFKNQYHEAKDMSTTLGVLIFNQNKAIGAWVGDSRIYHIRNKKILYKSEDHSLGRMLVSKGLISPTSVKYFPHKNIITRGVTGQSNHAIIDTIEITDIQSDDYFMLCTDGFHNTLKRDLINLFEPSQDISLLSQELKKACFVNSSDNYACHLLKIP